MNAHVGTANTTVTYWAPKADGSGFAAPTYHTGQMRSPWELEVVMVPEPYRLREGGFVFVGDPLTPARESKARRILDCKEMPDLRTLRQMQILTLSAGDDDGQCRLPKV